MITKMNQITKHKMVSPELFVQELICCSCRKICKISEVYWKGFQPWCPPAKRQLLSGNILDKMKAFPRSSLQTSFSITFLLSVSHTFPPHVHQPLERRREGMVRAVQEGM